MSHLPYSSYPTFGTRTLAQLHSSQAVRVGPLIEISGQGGWDPETEVIPTDLGEEIDGAFRNVQLALTTAGGKGWEGVYKIRVYVSLREGEKEKEGGWEEYGGHVVRNLWKWCPNHAPIMTFVEVEKLWNDMRIEIEAVEHVKEGA